jgi:hypothetical protein
MEASGKGILKTCSIVMIVFGGLSALFGLIGLIGAIGAASALNYYGYGMGLAALSGILIIATVVALISAALYIIIGIIGVKKSADPTQYNFFIVTGIILIVLQVVSLVMSFSALSFIGLIIPILYIYGGYQNKNAKSVQ